MYDFYTTIESRDSCLFRWFIFYTFIFLYFAINPIGADVCPHRMSYFHNLKIVSRPRVGRLTCNIKYGVTDTSYITLGQILRKNTLSVPRGRQISLSPEVFRVGPPCLRRRSAVYSLANIFSAPLDRVVNIMVALGVLRIQDTSIMI